MESIKLYRHKVYKDIYLKRNWHICGTSDANWWEGTKSLIEALGSYYKYDNECKCKVLQDIEQEYKARFYNCETNHSELKARIVLEKEIEFDGYIGKLTKELILPLDDFELIEFKESDKNECN